LKGEKMTEIKSITLDLWKKESKLTGKATIVDKAGETTTLFLDTKTACLIVIALHYLVASIRGKKK